MSKQASNKNTKSKQKKVQAKKKATVNIVVSNKSVPVSQSRGLVSKKAVITHSTNGRTVVSHSEFVSPILLPVNDGFRQLLRLRCNPGSEKTFLWLSNIARNYEFYKFKKLEFEYLNRCSTSTEGSLIMSPDYDGEDGAFASQERMLFDNQGTSDKSLWMDSKISLKPNLMNAMYKSHTNMSDARFSSTSQDQKTVDCAQVFVCSDATSIGKIAGKLIVHYVCEFWGPQSPTEPINEGGFKVTMVNNDTRTLILANSTKPFTTGVGMGIGDSYKQGDTNTEDILTSNVNSPTGVPIQFPTAVIGKFVRDYQGTLDTIANCITPSGNQKSNFYIGDASKGGLNTVAGSPASDVLVPQKVDWPINTNTDNPIQKLFVNAKKGDLLKVATGVMAGFQSMNTMFGGFSSSVDLPTIL